MTARSVFSILLLYAVLPLVSCSDYGLKVKKIDDQFYLILGEGGNSGVLFSDSAVLVIDTKVKTGAERMRRWIDDRAGKKKIYIINTHIHKDHTAGNHLYSNPDIIAGDYGNMFWNAVNSREDLPNHWLSDTMTLRIGDELVFIHNIGQAHSFNDVIVYLPKRKVLFTGDVVLNKVHPFLDEHVGANVDNYLTAIDDMLFTYDPKIVVPGHGDPGDKSTIIEFKNYLMEMREAANNPDLEAQMQEKYLDWMSLPINKAGFEQTLQYIRNSSSLRE